MAYIHSSPYAGTWYPGDAGELQELIASALESSCRRTGAYLLPDPIAFVVPHAGLIYSGTVAAAAYRHIQMRSPRRIVLLGFAHRGGPSGVSIPDIDGYGTPLGTTWVDQDAVSFLLRHPGFHRVAEERICDHSVEIQLPLVQQVAPDATIVPLYAGATPARQQQAAAKALAELAGDGTVFLASSDLTHYGPDFGYEPFPPDAKAPSRLAGLDRDVMEEAGSLDAGLFLDGLTHSGATVCGREPIALLLRVLATYGTQEVFQETLDYQTSGDITGDYRHSVSYGSLGYFPAASFELAAEDGARLLEIARSTIRRYLETGERVAGEPVHTIPPLTRRAGVFVTLYQNGKLHGCVGVPCGRGQLAESVPEMALAAALDDPRFGRLERAGGELEIEISLLSPMKRIRSRKSYRLYEHGAHLEWDGSRSLLLPQVPRERNWTAEKFWDALAQKAGLTPDVYDDPRTRLHIFRSQVISERRA